MADLKSPRKKIFISYSHGDEAWFTELKNRLLPLQRVHGFEIWDDKHLQPGQNWHDEIQKALGQTKLALLLVSPNFIRSEYIDKHEMKPLREAHERGEGVKVVPLYLRSADVDDYPFITKLQALNDPKTPLERLKEKPADLDDEFVAISRKIKALMQAPVGESGEAAAPRAATRPASRTSSALDEAAADDEAYDEEEDLDADEIEDDGDDQPLEDMLAQKLQEMFDDPTQQALDLHADDGEEATLLMRLTEGAQDNLICELACNDELSPDLKLDRKTLRMLVDEYEFFEPEYRGDRLWKDLGPIDDIDVDALGSHLAEVLELAFDVPTDDLAVVAEIYEV